MKKVKTKNKTYLISSGNQYYDDCPICRLMKKAEEKAGRQRLKKLSKLQKKPNPRERLSAVQFSKNQIKFNMNQFLVIIRGAPASGKTTIAKNFRDFNKKIVWLKVDNFKDFFSEDAFLEEQKYVDECALVSLKYLLDHDFSVVMEKIFYDPFIIPLAIESAEKRNIKSAVFQLKCSLETLRERDRNRPGIKERCRKPLGDEKIKMIFDQLEKTFYPDAISLDTEKLSVEECTRRIKESIGSGK